MPKLHKGLLVSGLVIATSPFCFIASAQNSTPSYIDVEAERAAREAAGVAAPERDRNLDPYGARPSQSYPATTYGAPATSYSVDGNAAGPATGATSQPAPGGFGGGSGSSSGGPNLGNLFYQLQQLQQEVMRLNGKVEEQAFQLRRMQEQSRERYLDIDKRMSELTTGGVLASSGSGNGASGGRSNEPAVVIPPAGTGKASGEEQPGEAEAYQEAYSMVTSRRFDRAIASFNEFLKEFPDGRYAPNASYWMGELYLVREPPDLEAARQSFALLLSEFPQHTKAADALYKLGTVQFMKGNREKAREYLNLVIEQYGSSNSAVAKLARDFISENY
ncbi:MAG: tol-pal system protein YbgF [Halioglobus sp.]